MARAFSIDHLENPDMGKATLRAALRHWGTTAQSLKAIEELGELQRALARELVYKQKGTGNHREILSNLEEEWADAMIMLLQMGMAYDFSSGMVQVKLNKLTKRLANEGADICDDEFMDSFFESLRNRGATITVEMDGKTYSSYVPEGE